MKVCVDVQSAITQRAGVGRYTRSLVRHLGETAEDGDELALFYFDFRRRALPFEAPRAESRPVRWCPGRLAQWAWKNLRWPPADFLAGPADLYHFPNFILPPLRRGKTVVTIHDLGFVRFPQFCEDRNRAHLAARIRDTVERADAILADSEFGAAEIGSLLACDRSRVFVVRPGIAQEFGGGGPAADTIAPTFARLGVATPYLLTVGTLEPRKNIPFLIEVFERLADFTGQLVIAGMPGWKYEPILRRMKMSSRADRIRYLKHVADEDLPALYAGADVFVLTSHYEGFGFPPLEAMACGTPVVASARGSLPEVLGPGAVLPDTFDSDRWAAEIRRILSDSGYRSELVSRGAAQAGRYTWSEAARKTWAVYRQVGA
ncbi:MAG: glycosyltransferase family 1 protein [Verrucomicrobiota bacterium]|nr:glycosyltransferase family 1 protein [Verrucomicrobiota bacterium]